VTDENAEAVVRICRRLDGIPLAIELAAARIKLLTVEQLDERLQDRFQMLTGGSRTELPRHQTLNGLIRWSYDLLSDEERLLFDQVSLFRGGWTLEAAEAVCTDVDPPQVLDLLTQLYDKSLILLGNDGSGPRFSQLETIREFGRSRLAERGLEPLLGERNALYFAGVVAQAAPYLDRWGSREEIYYRTRLTADFPNIQASLEWLATCGQPELAVRTVTALTSYWFLRGEIREGLNWLQRVLGRPDGCSRGAILEALVAEQAFLFQAADYRGSIDVGEPLIQEFEAKGDEQWAGWVRFYVGASWQKLGENETAEKMLREAGSTLLALGDYTTAAMTHMHRGLRRYEQGAYGEARALCTLAIDLIGQSGEPLSAVWPLFDLALIAIATSDLQTAANYLIEGAELVASGMTIMTWAYVSAAATIAVAQERLAEGAHLFGASQALTERTGATFEKAIFNRSIERLRRERPLAELEVAWNGGRSLGQDRALREAVEFCQSVLSSEISGREA
jgi:non-specific serine/threonine protein kinase